LLEIDVFASILPGESFGSAVVGRNGWPKDDRQPRDHFSYALAVGRRLRGNCAPLAIPAPAYSPNSPSTP
jgi:hypothetical protein